MPAPGEALRIAAFGVFLEIELDNLTRPGDPLPELLDVKSAALAAYAKAIEAERAIVEHVYFEESDAWEAAQRACLHPPDRLHRWSGEQPIDYPWTCLDCGAIGQDDGSGNRLIRWKIAGAIVLTEEP